MEVFTGERRVGDKGFDSNHNDRNGLSYTDRHALSDDNRQALSNDDRHALS